ncbi:hypothetical protein NP493_162g02019 [Ridgeia piscesae]|uniref:Uncharacterized protein n=1 Tax=Ridgeia piscesae TaxID=27915 RepID=A0AAD9P3N6_RIDPI|nr:hypothetical protein NP493_162g02019 [Ridgeia piscesae]
MASTILSYVTKRMFRGAAAVLCVVALVLQCFFLDHYLIVYNNNWWYLWLIPDIVSISLYIVSFVVSFRSKQEGAELPVGYISWGFYSVFIAAKVAIIFRTIAYQLNEEMIYGPNTLKAGVALSSVSFLLLVLTHQPTNVNSDHQMYINRLIGSVSIDILDTTDFLEVIFIQESRIFLTFSMHNTIIGVSCINLMLPTIPLLILSRTRYGRAEMPKVVHTIYTVVYMLAVNLPMLVIRLLLWNVHSQNVSVFLIKNVIHIGMIIKLVHDNVVDVEEQRRRASSQPSAGIEDIQMQPITAPAAQPLTGPSAAAV